MRIGIELIDLIPDRVGGVERYVLKLIEALTRLAPEHEYRFFARRCAVARLEAAARRFAVAADRRVPAWLPFVPYSLCQWVAVGAGLRAWQPDVFHNPMHFPRPAWPVRNRAVTVHDLLFDREPTSLGVANSRFMSWHCRAGVRQARRVIASSHFVKRELVELYGADPDRVDVVHLGVDSGMFQPPGNADAAADFRQPRGLPGGFLYFPATTVRHKNHVRLLHALRLLRDRYRLDVPLVLTGQPNIGHEEVFRAVADLGLERRVIWLGHLNTADVVRCYHAAAALVYPSTYEGFGLPVLEAMACGCPVACSNTTSTGEVAGDAAVMFDPADTEEMADALHRVLTDGALRDGLRLRGLDRAAEFNWDRTARDTLAVYERGRRRRTLPPLRRE